MLQFIVLAVALVRPAPAERTLAAIPLRELTPEKAVKALERHAATATLTPLPKERVLLVYADAPTTRANFAVC